MRLSFIFELLLIFVLLAFAASRVIDTKGSHNVRTTSLKKKHTKLNHKVRQQDTINRYCSCNTKLCNCCREFDIPVVSLKGPGCASLQYLNDEKLAISMSFGDRVLTNTTINSRRPRPICMPLPGGVSKFCGRVYNIGRQGQDFNACLGLELKALKDVEAALRVSCFKFGPQGLKVQPSQPLPPVEEDNDDDDDDDDDYDDEDDFGFDDDDDDDTEDDDDDDNDIESADYESFGLLDDDFIDGLFTSEGDDSESTPVRKTSTTTKAPLRRVTKKPLRKVTQKPVNTRKVTKKPLTPASSTTVNVVDVKVTKVTTAPPVVFIATSEPVVQTEKNPELVIPITNVTINEIPDSTMEDNMISPEKDSAPVMAHISNNIIPDSVNVSSSPITKVEITEVVTSSVNEPSSPPDMNPEKSPLTTQASSETIPTIAEDSSTTMDEKVATTEAVLADDDEEENEEPVQSFIIKNDDESEDEDEEDEDDSEESDPISDVVEDVLGVEDDKKEKKKDDSKVEKPADDEKEKESAESKDVVDDIIDGTVDMISFTDDSDEEHSSSKNELNKKEESDEDDLLDDDDDDEEDDLDDDDEDEARKAKSTSHRRGMKNTRLSRDMWLDRLHW
ncbi:hypothetical protein Trydic_g5069 [Trypoxylus dichotomus]